MRRLGTLDEWSRFLDAKEGEDAAAALLRLSRDLDQLHTELSTIVVRLFDSPTGEVADVLLIARCALAEAAGMLDSVRARFDDGERASA